MHEISLVRSLIAQVEQLVAREGSGAVRTIHLQCGPLSGVEPTLMKSAFELLRQESALSDASLLIEQTPLKAVCRECQIEFRPERFRFVCPRCGCVDVEVIAGDAVILESIELEPLSAGECV